MLSCVLNKFLLLFSGSGEIFRQRAQQQQQPMNFFPVTEKPRNVPAAPRGFKSMDLFPQQAGFGSSLPKMSDFLGDFRYASNPLQSNTNWDFVKFKWFDLIGVNGFD